MEIWEILGKTLEFYEDTHTYIYNGVVLPSITQMLKVRFGHKYDRVDSQTIQRASEMGTLVHKAVEDYEQLGAESELPELRNWKFLKRAYGFGCIDNEVPVVLFLDGDPIACGRLDLVLTENGKVGLGDIKRTSALDKEYLAYQLNLYRIAYQQDYYTEISFLRGVHLREDVRRYISLPINEGIAYDLINDYRRMTDDITRESN